MKKTIKYNSNQKRYFDITSIEKQDDIKLLKISFSSEDPYPRNFGMPVFEVIGHDDGDMDLSRLNNKAAVLFNHDFDELIGQVEKAWIENKRGYALIRISSTAEKYKVMIDEGILCKVSFGYEISDMVQIGMKDDIPVVKVKTKPYEVSLVSVPADDTVGLGKSKEEEEDDKELEIEIEDEDLDSELSEEDEKTLEEETEDKNKTADTEEEEKNKAKNERKFDNHNQILENSNYNNNNKGQKNMENNELLEIGAQFGQIELAYEFLKKGKSVKELTQAISEIRASEGSKMDAGTAKEYKSFSLGDFFKEQAEGINGKNVSMAKEFTQDLSKGRKTHNGLIIPKYIFEQRDYSVAGTAGNTARDDFRGSELIGNLYNTSVVRPLVRNLPTATGYSSVTIPKLKGKNNFYFLAEKQRANVSKVDFDDFVEFTPKTIGGRYTLTRDILLQSGLFVDQIAKQELLNAKDEFVDNELLNGDGVAGWFGIFNTPGALTVNFGTGGANGAMSYEKIVEMVSLINSKNNAGNSTFITNSVIEGRMKVTQQFANSALPILQGGRADGKPVAISNQVGDNQIALINGNDFAYLEWDGYEIVVAKERLGGGMVEVELFLTADFQNLRTEGVVLAKDVI